MTWTYNNVTFEDTPEEYQGFVYQLTEVHSNKKYIGKKNFWKPKTLPITKTRRDAYARASSQTGKNITDPPMKYATLWKQMDKTNSKEKY